MAGKAAGKVGHPGYYALYVLLFCFFSQNFFRPKERVRFKPEQ